MAKDELKREDIIPVLDEYYKSIGRVKTPNYKDYSLAELRKVLVMFGIKLVYQKDA